LLSLKRTPLLIGSLESSLTSKRSFLNTVGIKSTPWNNFQSHVHLLLCCKNNQLLYDLFV
jgi:hypothetical protein